MGRHEVRAVAKPPLFFFLFSVVSECFRLQVLQFLDILQMQVLLKLWSCQKLLVNSKNPQSKRRWNHKCQPQHESHHSWRSQTFPPKESSCSSQQHPAIIVQLPGPGQIVNDSPWIQNIIYTVYIYICVWWIVVIYIYNYIYVYIYSISQIPKRKMMLNRFGHPVWLWQQIDRVCCHHCPQRFHLCGRFTFPEAGRRCAIHILFPAVIQSMLCQVGPEKLRNTTQKGLKQV